MLDKHARSGTTPKIGSDSRVIALRSGRSSPKHFDQRTCASCDQALPALTSFDRVAINYRTDIWISHDVCRKCRDKIRSSWADDPLYGPALDSFWHQYMPSLRAGAYGRSIIMAVDADDLIGLYLRQRGYCALSGLELDLKTKGKIGRSNRAYLRPSVDRIDSSANYTIGNIQIVAQAINLMKGALSQKTFVEICGAVSRHNISL